MRRFEVQFFWVAMLLGVYLAVATLLRAARHHSTVWEPWHPLFVAMVAAAVFVPIYAFLKTLDARELEADAAERKLEADLEIFCKRSVSAIAEQCPEVSVNDLSVGVWLCRADGGFDRRVSFMLPDARPRSGIDWRKGKGIAGTAWARREEIGTDLSGLIGDLETLGDEEFNRLSESRRYGMTAAEVRKTTRYTGIYAIPLFARDDPYTTLGVFVVDYTGGTGFPRVQRAAEERPIRVYSGACEEILTGARSMLGV